MLTEHRKTLFHATCLSFSRHLSSLGTTAAPGGTTGTATAAPLAAEATTATVATEVATATTLALLEVTALLAVELLLLLGAGASGAALLDPELLVADLEGAGGEGVLVALGGLEVDKCAALRMKSVKYRQAQ